MTTVFISGSLSIKRLHKLFADRIRNVVESGFSVVVGDADGADASIQKELLNLHASHVTIYCSGSEPRNNVGNWPIETVRAAHSPGSRAYFTAKDIEMAKVADYGLMIWDTKSTGTLSNVIELLKNGHGSRVFVNKDQSFITVSDAEGLKQLVETMSDSARFKAEEKIGLSKKMAAIEHKQLALSF